MISVLIGTNLQEVFIPLEVRALTITAVAWAKEHELVAKDVKWFKENWSRELVFVNNRARLIWDFEFNVRKSMTSQEKARFDTREQGNQKDLVLQHGVPTGTKYRRNEP